MLFSVEGLDGVGKSTIVNELAKSFNMSVVEKPIKKLLDLNPEQSSRITAKIYGEYSSNIQAMYYLMGYLSALEDSKKRNIIMDRGFLSTYYFSFNEENKALFDFYATVYGFPELTIILYASVEERIKRIQSRDLADRDLKKERMYSNGYDKYFSAIEKYKIPHIIINTEYFSLEEVLELLEVILEKWINDKGAQGSILNLFSLGNFYEISSLTLGEIKEKLSSLSQSNIQTKRKGLK